MYIVLPHIEKRNSLTNSHRIMYCLR